MNYNAAMRKECVTVNADGSYTVKGGGWFWCRIGADKKTILEYAPGMTGKKSLRLFLSNAKLTIEKHFP
jgi:hypothetical protein